MAKPVELGLVLEGEDAKRFIEYDDNPKASPLVLAMIAEGRESIVRKTREKSENSEHENLENELVILPLDEPDDLSSFNCESEELNDFLKTNAWADQII